MYSDGTLQSRQAPAPRHIRPASVILSACFACFACALALAQSGRTPPPPSPPAPPQPGDTRPRQVNSKRRELPSAFIVVTAPPDGSQETSPFVSSGYPPTTDFEEIARGGCLVALRNQNGVKRVVGDLDVPRWEARETALGEDEAWVVWLELRWQQNVTMRETAPFKLRYLLFEPRTGKIISSGYGRGVRQTWGLPLPRTSIENQLRNAGRDIADQIVSELTKAP